MEPGISKTPAEKMACAHCGLEARQKSHDPAAPAFCCSGCETVYDLLHQSGVADTYYRLRTGAIKTDHSLPAFTDVQPGLLAELDSTAFLDHHSDLLDDGLRRTSLYLEGVHCAACVWLVEQMPMEVDGVRRTTLDLRKSRITIEWQPDSVSLSGIGTWLSKRGYAFQPRVYSGKEALAEQERSELIRAGVSWALAGNIMLISFALYSGLDELAPSTLFTAARWLSLLLTIPVLAFGGKPFFVRAAASVSLSLKNRSIRHIHMDTPIAVGLSIGFLASAVNTFRGSGEVWFDSLAVLVAALLTARWLHIRSRRAAGTQADELLALIPSMARVDNDAEGSGRREWKATTELNAGEVVYVMPGEIIPVDGQILSGRSHIDEAVLTGESSPSLAESGRAVFAGSTNLSEELTIEVLTAGRETRVGSLLEWIDDDGEAVREAKGAERSRDLGAIPWHESIAGYFVATVLFVAATTFIVWSIIDPSRAVSNVVALLVITCPCALAMAAPLANAVFTGVSARRGIFVRNESSMDALRATDVFVFDKTGTLTPGRPNVTATYGDASAVEFAARIESDIEHPVARAIIDYVDQTSGTPSIVLNGDHVSERVSEVGLGVSGVISARQITVGRPDWVFGQSAGTHFDRNTADDLAALCDRIATEAQTPVAISIDGSVRAIVAIGERSQEGVDELFQYLGDRGAAVYVCSGDHPKTVREFGKTLGLLPESSLGGLLPDEKRDFITSLQSDGHTVTMIGDGVNDTAALRTADVGIAVGGSTMAGRLSADIFLTASNVLALKRVIKTAGSMTVTVQAALLFSLAYNIVGAAAAAGGFVSPLIAAIAMPVSSISVISLILMRGRTSG